MAGSMEDEMDRVSNQPLVSVVIATYNRSHLLERALVSYLMQDYPIESLEFIYIDDWSEDDTDWMLREWSKVLNISVIRPPYKEPGHWRSEASIINQGIRAAKGDLVLVSHPEVMPGVSSISDMVAKYKTVTSDRFWFSCKTYFLTPDQTNELDEINWQASRRNVTLLPGFYENSAILRGAGDTYTHRNVEKAQHWPTWQFAAMSKEGWRWMGGLTEFETWGSVDVDWHSRRRALNMADLVCMEPDSICVHQNHDDISDQYRKFETIVPIDYSAVSPFLNHI